MDAAEEVNAAESDPMRYAATEPDRPPELDGAPLPKPTPEAG